MTRTFRLRLAGIGLIMALGAFAATAGDAVFPTGSRVGLAPLAGFATSERFLGFEDTASGATIKILEMPEAAYAEMARQMTREALKQQGVIEETREPLTLTTGKGTLISGRPDGPAKGRKWILLASAPESAALVLVDAPDSAKDVYTDAAVRKMLSSFAVRASVPIEEQLALLPLRFDDLSGMRPVRVLGMSGAVLTKGPKDAVEPGDQPVLLVSVGRGGPDEGSARDNFARNLFVGIGNFKDIRVVGADMLRLGGGLQTHQLLAEGRDAKTNAPVKLVQWIRFGAGAYLRILGVAREEDWTDAFPRFRAVRDGVAPRG